MRDYLIGPETITPYEDAFKESIRRYKALAPNIISENTGCPYHPKENCFELRCFQMDLRITYPEGIVYYKGTNINPPVTWRLIILNYFSFAKKVPLSNEWISYLEQPGGRVFYPNIVNTVINPLGRFYHRVDSDKLRSILKDLRFDLSGNADHLIATGYFAPRIPVQLHFWSGDEDFPAGFQLLFDKTVSFQMHIEDSAALCYMIEAIVQNEYR